MSADNILDDSRLADSAVLIIDVINDFAFPGSDQLLEQMPPVVEAIDTAPPRRCPAAAGDPRE